MAIRSFVQSNGPGRAESNGVPNQLDLVYSDATRQQKLARGIRAIHFKAFRPGERVRQAKIMENRGDCQQFRIGLQVRSFRDSNGKEPGAHDMVEEIRWRMSLDEIDGLSN